MSLWLRFRALLRRRQTERDLDDELQFHLEMQTRKHLAAGSKAPEAARLAAVQFGGLSKYQEQCRDSRGVRWIFETGQDVRYALRGFRRTPAFALTVIATIALGLGVNTALFTVFNAYVLRPLAVRDPYSLYRFTWTSKNGDGHWFTWHDYQDLRKQSAPFSEILGRQQLITRIQGHLMIGNLVTGNYFATLGVIPAAGRTLLAGDTISPGSEPVLVISHTAWKNKLGSDPAIIGKKLLVHGYPMEVVGVMREGFTGLSEVPLDFWAPLTMAPLLDDGPSLFGSEQPARIRISGRLRHDWTLANGESALLAWAGRRTAALPPAEQATGITLRSEATTIALDPLVIAAASPVFLSFGLVLLIACANVANMTIARGMTRQREIGIRLAIGAPRTRLIRQLLTESILLSLPAALLGFGIAAGTIDGCVRLMFATLPAGFLDFVTLIPLRPDWRVLEYMLAAAMGSAVMFGLLPAIQSTRLNVMQAARGEFTTDARPSRLRNTLVVTQAAVSVLFLICAAVSMRANGRLEGLDVGLQVQHVVRIEAPGKILPEMIRQVSADPEVEMVAETSKTPFEGGLGAVPVGSVDRREVMWGRYIHVSPNYFQIFQIPVLRGRTFTTDEATAGAHVVILSQATARSIWGDRDPLGQSLRVSRDLRRSYQPDAPADGVFTVVGVTPDVVNGYIGYGIDSSCVYFPLTQSPILLVRVKGDAAAARQRLDAALARTMPGAVRQIHTMREIQNVQLYPFRALYWMSSAVGGLALLLTLSGIYGVLSYFVTQRTKEIGIRVALGAQTVQIVQLILKQSMRLALAGCLAGSVLALGFSKLLASQADLFMFDGFDGAAYALGALLAIAAAAAAAFFPALRAARVEPLITLRYD